MRRLVWNPPAEREFRRFLRSHRDLRDRVESTLEQLVIDPFHLSLRTHLLRGELDGLWSCSVTYQFRILFKVQVDDESDDEFIYPISVGSHDEVY
jgi:mRNA-degrading endonuclease YafQ of YafQ-DinJ toxin-antitoxin module